MILAKLFLVIVALILNLPRSVLSFDPHESIPLNTFFLHYKEGKAVSYLQPFINIAYLMSNYNKCHKVWSEISVPVTFGKDPIFYVSEEMLTWDTSYKNLSHLSFCIVLLLDRGVSEQGFKNAMKTRRMHPYVNIYSKIPRHAKLSIPDNGVYDSRSFAYHLKMALFLRFFYSGMYNKKIVRDYKEMFADIAQVNEKFYFLGRERWDMSLLTSMIKSDSFNHHIARVKMFHAHDLWDRIFEYLLEKSDETIFFTNLFLIQFASTRDFAMFDKLILWIMKNHKLDRNAIFKKIVSILFELNRTEFFPRLFSVVELSQFSMWRQLIFSVGPLAATQVQNAQSPSENLQIYTNAFGSSFEPNFEELSYISALNKYVTSFQTEV